MKTVIICAIFLKLVYSFTWTGSHKVKVDEGEIVGGEYLQWDEFATMRAYLGVPYAESPVGNLRFKPPVPKQPWTGSIEATSFPPSCMQDNNKGSVLDIYATSPLWNGTGQTSKVSEDCLTLNIFRPEPLNPAISLPFPVMVWIHGGGFRSGSGNPSGFRLAESGNVIVVTINYRLGVFGFMSTEDKAIAGNLGLWDQHLALKWIKNNIQRFDGDPNKITLFGESAGSISVGFHLFHNKSSNPKLFHRAIMQSGHIYTPVQNNATQPAISLAEKLKCPDMTNTNKMVECLQQTDAQTLFNTAEQVVPSGFGPVIDGTFIADTAENLLKNSNLDIDILTGVNQHEGWLYPLAWEGFARTGINKTEFLEIAMSPGILNIQEWRDDIKQALLNQYAPHESPNNSEAWYLALIDAAGDRIFNAPTANFLSKTVSRNKGNAFMYLFDVANSYERPDKPNFVGATHTDELLYMFADLQYYEKATPTEEKVSRDMAKMWTDFARTGNVINAVTGDVVEPWTVENQDYLKITSNMGKDSLKQHLWPERMAFWNDEFPKLEEQSVITVDQGELIGKIRDQNGKYQCEEFLGVPFAAPPTGNNRFREAQEPNKWTEVLEAKSYRHACIQIELNMDFINVERSAEVIGDGMKQSEDCLYLNVFVPKSVRDAKTRMLPVMVWIYGGGFVTGKTTDYHLSTFAATNDVLVVTVSYRLGLFGFFSLGKEATGNYGLTDQQMALKWVNRNIGEFGGNPQDVTIFGESAGGASVMFQVLNEESRTYFQKAIPMSGTVETPGLLEREGKTEKHSRDLVSTLGCNRSADVMTCMRDYADASKIHQLDFPQGLPQEIRYKPVVDEQFVKSSELYAVGKKNFIDITLLLGVNSLERALTAEDMLRIHNVSTDGISVNMTRFWNIIDDSFDIWTAPSSRTPIARAFIMHEYFAGMTNDLTDVTMRLAMFLSDNHFTAGAIKTASKHSKEGGRSFFYVFGLDRTDSIRELPKAKLSGAAHGEDLLVAFGSPFLDLPNYTDEARTASKNFMAMITNFAKTGDPSFNGVKFPAFDSDSKRYVELKVTGEVKKKPWPRRMAFWNELLPTLSTVAHSSTTATITEPQSSTTENQGISSTTATITEPQSSEAALTTTTENTAVEADALGSLGIPAKDVEIALWVMIGVSCLCMLVIIKLSCDACRRRKAEDITAF